MIILSNILKDTKWAFIIVLWKFDDLNEKHYIIKMCKKDKLSLTLRSNYKRSVQFTNCPTWKIIFTWNWLELSHLRILLHKNHQISFHHSTLLFIDERLFVQYFISLIFWEVRLSYFWIYRWFKFKWCHLPLKKILE